MKKISIAFLLFQLLSIFTLLYSEEYLFLYSYNDKLCYISRDKNCIFLNIGLNTERRKLKITPTPAFKVEICIVDNKIYLFNSGQIQIFDSKLSLLQQYDQGKNLTPALWQISTEGEYVLNWSGDSTSFGAYFLISNSGVTPIKSIISLHGFNLEEKNNSIYLNGNLLDNKLFEPLSHLGSILESVLQISFFFDGKYFFARGNIIDQNGKQINAFPINYNFSNALKLENGYLLLSPDKIFLIDQKWNLIKKWDADQPEYLGKLNGKYPLVKMKRSISVMIPEKLKLDCIYRTPNKIAGCVFVIKRIWITEKLKYGSYSKKLFCMIPKIK